MFRFRANILSMTVYQLKGPVHLSLAMPSKLIFSLHITTVFLYASTFATNDVRQSRLINRIRDGGRDRSEQSIELIKQLLNYLVKTQGMRGKEENGGVGGIKEFGSGAVGKHYDNDETDETDSLKPIISGAIVEVKKQLAAKERAIRLFGTIQRVTGDFWVALINTIKTIGNFLDILFSPILKATQPPPLKI
ncbi:unnamed protein product [Litomosoides sigmodontis]|uniref:Uncharacterized protein n=1 Tax=Litomosoides sigmodontis TaxID=42156 RepID=A0A3P6U8K7_LITSI|nr:unnamed protein product [Litomosoides sigmodontis]